VVEGRRGCSNAFSRSFTPFIKEFFEVGVLRRFSTDTPS
jgi:hypothetical protein